ncbi:MAG TPA: hypothetical protein VFP34_05090 [Microlunatus sp.]|nr:hypothetical protein [Microlunatus sp.]
MIEVLSGLEDEALYVASPVLFAFIYDATIELIDDLRSGKRPPPGLNPMGSPSAYENAYSTADAVV